MVGEDESMTTNDGVRFTSWLGLIVLVCAVGCATKSTVQTRKQERAAAYADLPVEQRQLVDQGQIQVGMNEDAVYIAWGKPAEVLRAGDAAGETVTWLYHGTTSDEYVFWRYHEVPRPGGGRYLTRHLDRDINVRDYVSAELVFREGLLASWRMLPKPPASTHWGPVGWP
jgi:deoxyinosine 3'endonuclease (endonuclease V)